MNKINHFASVAEAVAHYVKLGFVTLAENDQSRIMTKRTEKGSVLGEVVIFRDGFLSVIAEETV